jgi:hypothetical protein
MGMLSKLARSLFKAASLANSAAVLGSDKPHA